MTVFERFHYRALEELQAEINELQLDISLKQDLSPLARQPKIGRRQLPNSLAVHPMEGCDGETDGSPSELTIRRYRRFAGGGAGLLWFEAAAVVPEGRANPRQLYIAAHNYRSFRQMLQLVRQDARAVMGEGHEPLCLLQLTHSGRYSKPQGSPQPVIAFHDPLLDSGAGVADELRPINDEELDRLQESYVAAACYAKEAGFDGVDIKSCHRYLLSELLAGYTRPGKYGGSFFNRTRFLLETVEKVRAAVGSDFVLAVRMNVFDAHPYPYGWGVHSSQPLLPDTAEPKQLAVELKKRGVSLISVSAGNPYYSQPQVGRPLDRPAAGGRLPEEHPLRSVARLFKLGSEMQSAVPDLAVVGCGYSWLRQFLGYAAAANIAGGKVTVAGVGREAFAYPDFARDLLHKGAMDRRQVCIACSKCTQIMRDGGRTGCVVRDSAIYQPIYRAGRANAR